MQHSCGQIYDKSTYSVELVIRVYNRGLLWHPFFQSVKKKERKKKHDKVIMFT